MRVKKGLSAHQKHLKVRRATKGMQHGRRRSFRLGKQALIRALQYSTRDRKVRKRDFRALWITRINIAVRQHGLTYATFIQKLKIKNIDLDRKVLSELAINHPAVFQTLVEKVK